MKVLIVPSWYPTEISSISGVFFQEQALALKKNGVDVTVAYPEMRSLRNFNKYQMKSGIHYEMEKGLRTYRRRGYNYLPRMKNHVRKKYLEWLENLFDEIVKDQGKPDLIHAHSILYGGWAAAQISKKHNIPLVVTEHSTSFSRGLISEENKLYIKECLTIAQEIIAVGPGLQNDLSVYTDREVKIIPNIVDTKRFNAVKETVNKNEEFRFFSLAFLTYKKGIDVLLNAFANGFNNNEQVELIIGGEGEEKNKLMELAKELNIEGRVTFLGELSREQAALEMKKCDSFVLPSRYETFGVVFIEALACGKPIVATKSGGPDLIVNEENGLLVDVNDVKGLATAMQNIVKHYETYSEKEIIKDCHNRFSEEAVSKQLKELYYSLVH